MENKGTQDYYNDFKETGLKIDTTMLFNELKLVENYFHQQIVLVANGKSYEAKLNLNKGKVLVDKFRLTDNIILNEIELNINSKRKKIVNTQTIHKYVLINLGIVLIVCNFIFFSYIWSSMHEEIKKG